MLVDRIERRARIIGLALADMLTGRAGPLEQRRLRHEQRALLAWHTRDIDTLPQPAAHEPQQRWVVDMRHGWDEQPERTLSGAIPMPYTPHQNLPARHGPSEQAAEATITTGLAIGYVRGLLLAAQRGLISHAEALAELTALEVSLHRSGSRARHRAAEAALTLRARPL